MFVTKPRPRAALCGFASRWTLAAMVGACLAAPVAAQGPKRVVHKLESPNETLEITVNTSRILTLDEEIPRAQVNNPEILDLTALSPTQVQVMAKKPGVTQVNLWDQNDEIHSVDVIVLPDAQELAMLLRSQFPKAALKVVPLANSVIVSGYVDDPSQVQPIIQMAEDYHSKVINHITVGGVQQVLLQVKVYEVSRTKLRTLGFDWGVLGGSADSFAVNGVGSLLNTTAAQGGAAAATGGAATALGALSPAQTQNLNFGVINGGSTFLGVLDLLTQKNVAKVISEPNLSTVSGRPASMIVGGEIAIPVAQSLGRISIQWKQYGTQVDFVPIVLGNGAVRLEVRPRVSELDYSNAIPINGTTVPGIKARQVDTAAELRAGQTMAVAGLVQLKVDSASRGIIGISDLPWIGIPFRKVTDTVSEVEMLILVTPQLVEAMDPGEVPPGGPGFATALPTNHQLYCKGFLEVPNCEGPNMFGPYPNAYGMFPPLTPNDWSEEQVPPGATEIPLQPSGGQPKAQPRAGQSPAPPPDAQPQPPLPPSLSPPSDDSQSRRATPRRATASGPSSRRKPAGGNLSLVAPTKSDGRNPSIMHNSSNRTKPTTSTGGSPRKSPPGFIGPTGYDLR